MTESINNYLDTKGLKSMLFAEFGCCAALFLLTLVYFPTKPPTPPTVTAGVDRIEFKKGLKQLLQLRPLNVNKLTDSLLLHLYKPPTVAYVTALQYRKNSTPRNV